MIVFVGAVGRASDLRFIGLVFESYFEPFASTLRNPAAQVDQKRDR